MILTVTMNPAIDKIYFVDNYQLGEVHRPSKLIASAGGKGLNVARVSKLVGEEVTATGLLGGSSGQFIHNEVLRLGIKSEFENVLGETRVCINVTDQLNQLCTEVLEPGPTITEEEAYNFINRYRKLAQQANVITLSGSLPKGVPSSFYTKLVEIGGELEKKVLLDSSSTPFIEGVKAQPYLIKPNKDEIKQIYDGDISNIDGISKAIRYFKSIGIEIPVISMGKEGSIAGLKDGIYQLTIPPVDVINTVGSGDSFIAGCAVGFERGYSDLDAVKLGTACGTANTQFPQTGYVTKKTVDYFFSQVMINKLMDEYCYLK